MLRMARSRCKAKQPKRWMIDDAGLVMIRQNTNLEIRDLPDLSANPRLRTMRRSAPGR